MEGGREGGGAGPGGLAAALEEVKAEESRPQTGESRVHFRARRRLQSRARGALAEAPVPQSPGAALCGEGLGPNSRGQCCTEGWPSVPTRQRPTAPHAPGSRRELPCYFCLKKGQLFPPLGFHSLKLLAGSHKRNSVINGRFPPPLYPTHSELNYKLSEC